MTAVEMAAYGWSISVDPRRGAKITSLVDPSGTEWLARREGPEIPADGTPFIEAEMCGWDECAPSIVACESATMDVPDHGSLWDRGFSDGEDELVAVDERLGFSFARRIRISAEAVRIEYRASGSRRLPFLWAAHPQFVSPPGTVLEIDPGIRHLVDVTGPEPELVEREAALPAGAADLDPGTCRKLYVAPEDRAFQATIRRPHGPALTMAWSDNVPYLGLWLDHGAYSREPVIAVEPATGWFDSVAYAERAGHVAWLEPGRDLTWWIDLTASPTPAPEVHA